MCGRYGIDDERDDRELRGILDAVNRRVVIEPITTGDVFPSCIAPVLASNRRISPDAFAMRWGYVLPDGKRVINARSETAADRPLFRDGMLKRRCAVPATHYYEWERANGKRTKYAIWPTEGRMFYMAGLYRMASDMPEFTILTRKPAEDIAFIHDRMPVILPRALVGDWIDPRRDAGELLKHAVLSVTYEKRAGHEQLSMPI